MRKTFFSDYFKDYETEIMFPQSLHKQKEYIIIERKFFLTVYKTSAAGSFQLLSILFLYSANM